MIFALFCASSCFGHEKIGKMHLMHTEGETSTDTVVIHLGWPPWIFTMPTERDDDPKEIRHYFAGVPHSVCVDSGVDLGDLYMFDDIDRDGYTDILVGDQGNPTTGYQAYLFDTADSSFKYDPEFDMVDIDDSHILGGPASDTYETEGHCCIPTIEDYETYKVVDHHPLLVHTEHIDEIGPEQKNSWFYQTDSLGDGSTGLEIDTIWHGIHDVDVEVDDDTLYQISKFKTYDASAPQVVTESPLLHDRSKDYTPLSTYLFEDETRHYSHDREGRFFTFTLKKAKHGKLVTVRTGKVYLKKK
jgi:hypothetical protein